MLQDLRAQVLNPDVSANSLCFTVMRSDHSEGRICVWPSRASDFLFLYRLRAGLALAD